MSTHTCQNLAIASLAKYGDVGQGIEDVLPCWNSKHDGWMWILVL